MHFSDCAYAWWGPNVRISNTKYLYIVFINDIFSITIWVKIYIWKWNCLGIGFLHSSWHCLQRFLQNLMIHVIQHLKMFHRASYVLWRKKQHLAFGANLFTFDQWPRINAKEKWWQSQSFRPYCILYHLQTSGLDLVLNEDYQCKRSCSSVRLLWHMGVFWVLSAEWWGCSKNMWPLGCAVHFHSPTKILITNWF